MSNEEGIKWAAVPPPQKKQVPTWVWIVVPIVAVFMICGVAAAVMGNDSPTPIPESAVLSNDNVFQYGETATVGKFAVTLTPVSDYVPNQYTLGYSGGEVSAFQVTVRNDSDVPIDLFSVMIRGTISGGQPAEKIFDSGGGIDWIPTGELFPSESATFRIAFDGTVSRVKVEGFLDFSPPVYFVS